jgi:hypothetical protein
MEASKSIFRLSPRTAGAPALEPDGPNSALELIEAGAAVNASRDEKQWRVFGVYSR